MERTDAFNFSVFEIAVFTGIGQQVRNLEREYGISKNKGEVGEDCSHWTTVHSTPAPDLKVSVEEESDYLNGGGCTECLGRIIMTPEARQWLLTRRKIVLGANNVAIAALNR